MEFEGLKNLVNNFGIYKLIGFELTHLDKEKAVFECVLKPEHSNIMGMLHGSVPFAMMDTAIGFCFVPHSENDPGSATAEIKVNYIKPQKADGSRIRCEARVIHLGQRSGVAEARVFNEKGEIIAVALGSVARKPIAKIGG